MPAKRQYTLHLLTISLITIVIFGIILNNLLTYSFWIDEGFSAWVIRDGMRDPNTLRETLRFVRDSFLNTFNDVQSDVHPPLYYLLLDGWALLIGESKFSLRLPSALLATLSLASIYALGRQWFNFKTGIIALLILGTSGFYLYYAREARMYSLYLALATMSMWSYTLWWRKPTIRRGLLYSLILTLLLYTHYTSFTIMLAQIIHAFFTIKSRSPRAQRWQFFIPFGLVFLAFSPWMPFLIRQIEINTGFSAPGAISSDWGTVAAIWLKLTSGYWGIFALIFILSKAILSVHKKYGSILLLLLWGLVPTGVLFAINAQGLAILQLRYLTPIIAAWSLLIAHLLSNMWIPLVKNRRLGILVTIFFTVWILYTQLATYYIHWVPKPDWRTAANIATENRHAQEPALVYLDEHSPLSYYAHQTGLLDGINLNLRWREFSLHEIQNITDSLDDAEIVWTFMEMQAPTSWDVIAELIDNRGVSYRDSVQGTILYQFDTDLDESLALTFGTSGENPIFTYRGDIYAQYHRSTDNEICVPIILEALTEIDESYTLHLHLTHGYNEVVAQSETRLEAYSTGDLINRELCVSQPSDDHFHLRLLISSPELTTPLYVMESDLLWGNHLILGIVEQATE